MVSALKVILIVAVAVVLVAVIGFAALFSTIMNTPPPVDVYARPTPAISIEPVSLIPDSVAGRSPVSTEQAPDGSAVRRTYDGRIQVSVIKWDNVNQAFNYMTDNYGDSTSISTSSGESTARVRSGDADWFAQTLGSGESILIWRKGQWTFGVSAPTKELRDSVLQELQF